MEKSMRIGARCILRRERNWRADGYGITGVRILTCLDSSGFDSYKKYQVCVETIFGPKWVDADDIWVISP